MKLSRKLSQKRAVKDLNLYNASKFPGVPFLFSSRCLNCQKNKGSFPKEGIYIQVGFSFVDDRKVDRM